MKGLDQTVKGFSTWCKRTTSTTKHSQPIYAIIQHSCTTTTHHTHSAHTWTHCSSTALITPFISLQHCFHSSSNAAVQGQDVDDNDDGVIHPLYTSPSYPNNPQPSHTFAVKASDDIMSLSMIKLDAPYPIRQSRSISPMARYGKVQYSRRLIN